MTNGIEPYLLLARKGIIEDLRLDEEDSMGYTLKTLSAAIWCLYHVTNFNDGLLAIVNAGGDADTNAAVACSLLGAKYGFEHIPHGYIESLRHQDLLEELAATVSSIILLSP